ncbi:MAG: hypothetical protein WC496_09895 [Phycisphaerae bacterium]
MIPKYSLGDNGEFVIENYNQAKPFASFFPGIAGADGIPMWVFYVNRGQCLCSIGLEDKQKPIMEFLSANAAYQLSSTQGFRTFVKIFYGKKGFLYEPFQDKLEQRSMKITQKMIIRPESLSIEEENKTLGLYFKVDFFNIVRENYAGLVRKLTIENRTTKKIKMEVLDGLPLIIPFGVDNYNLKNMRRLVESFVEVTNLKNNAPYFKIRTKQQDSPEVIPVKEGNFYLGFIGGKAKGKIISPIVDPEKIFAHLTDYSYPKVFAGQTPYKLNGTQITENRLPCAMGYFTAVISPKKSCEYNSIIGSISSVEKLNKLITQMCSGSYIPRKQSENQTVIEQLTQNNFVHSSSNEFDLYCRQNFLDNTLRGGFPVSLRHRDKSTTLHLYSRKHGDLERDYNDFQLSPTNYSQGNGNFRDVNQNRRNDLLFNPDVKTDNIEQFYNMIQLDGFNPLIVKPVSFEITNTPKLKQIIKAAFSSEQAACVLQLFKKHYTPGQITTYLDERNIKIKIGMPAFIAQILTISKKVSQPDCGHGFWSDHWCYNLDLFENYLAVWPENLRYILFEKNDFTFFDNHHYVLPREDKYVLWCGKPMQIDSVARSSKKESLIKQRSERKNEVRTRYGKGEIYNTTLAHKIISIIVNKIASLDFEGIGIEMESDKPNWYDALNGLPGLFGSSLCETLELKRLIIFTLDSIEKSNIKKISIANETYNFISKIKKLLKTNKNGFDYWNKSASCKEEYRTEIFFGVSGKQKTVSIAELKQFLISALDKLNYGIAKAQAKSKAGVLPSYFINQPITYKKIITNGNPKLNGRGFQCIKVTKFKQHPLPSFLEGPVHFLRIEKNKNKTLAMAKAVRKSGLFDEKLKMYKVNEPLLDQPMEIGRTKTFSRGWLENESIWTHMEYKYMLELLRSGLFEQFYTDFKNVFVPFMNPQIYGRSILENSSFIASSANPDANIHGTGFVARLSGSTAEFIHIFLMMAVGEKPFTIDHNGKVTLHLNPAIPDWLFTTRPQTKNLWINNKQVKQNFAAKTLSFMFLGDILVTYKNPKMKNTFGDDCVKPIAAEIKDINGRITKIKGGVFDETIARKAREHKIQSIEIELG